MEYKYKRHTTIDQQSAIDYKIANRAICPLTILDITTAIEENNTRCNNDYSRQ